LKKPIIILPEECVSLDDDDIKAILQHEWRHYLNKDLWIKILSTVLCCVMWWNPAVYLLRSNLDKTLELKCDLDVAKNMNDEETIRYMESIINLGKLLRETEMREGPPVGNFVPLHLSILFVGASAKNIKVADDYYVRFQMMLPLEKRNHKISMMCCAVLVVLFLFSYGFVVQPFIHAYYKDDFFVQVNKNDYVTFKGWETETAYVLYDGDGTYSFYFQGVFWSYIEDDADLESVFRIFGEIPIIYSDTIDE